MNRAKEPINTGPYPVHVHLWSRGADHVLYTLQGFPGGREGRWSGEPILAFSPGRSYVAISDYGFALVGHRVRIFSVADGRQKFVAATTSSGGTWLADDRFVWATGATSDTVPGKLIQWTAAGGATALRTEYWYNPTSSPDGRWLGGVLASDLTRPRVIVAPTGSG